MAKYSSFFCHEAEALLDYDERPLSVKISSSRLLDTEYSEKFWSRLALILGNPENKVSVYFVLPTDIVHLSDGRHIFQEITDHLSHYLNEHYLKPEIPQERITYWFTPELLESETHYQEDGVIVILHSGETLKFEAKEAINEANSDIL